MPKLTPEQYEAVCAKIEKLLAQFANPTAEDLARWAREKEAHRRKLGWGQGIIRRRCPNCNPKYGALVAA